MFSAITSKRQIFSLLLSRVPKYNFSRTLKSNDAEPYLKVNTKADPNQIENSPALEQVQKFEKKEYKRGLQENEKPIPTSPVLGPIRVKFKLHSFINWFFRLKIPLSLIKFIVGAHAV